MASKKSLVPLKVQVPAAIVLASVLVALLVFRGMKNNGDADSTVQAANRDMDVAIVPEIAQERVPLNDLNNLVLSFQGQSESATRAPTLKTNPFLIPEDAFSTILPDQAEFEGEEEDSSDPDVSRARELHSVVLTGTSKIGERYMAIVDGMVLGEGDRIGGYVIVEVGEGVLFLENRRGVRIVRMKEGASR